MKQNTLTHHQHQTGFTLVEVLIVMAIIGIMSSFFITNYTSARNKATDAKRRADMSQVKKALELYYNTYGEYPTTNGSWYGLAEQGTDGFKNTSGANGYIPNLAPTFVSQLPQDPSGDVSEWSGYLYKSDGNNYKFLSHTNGPKSFPEVGNEFYDPARPTEAWKVSNNDSATSSNCPAISTCW